MSVAIGLLPPPAGEILELVRRGIDADLRKLLSATYDFFSRWTVHRIT
jgi:hypothetical protein